MDEVLEMLDEVETKSQIMHAQNPVMYEPLVIHFLEKYVDDCLYAGEETKIGTKYDPINKVLVWDIEQEDKDKESQLTIQQLSIKLVAEIASKLLDGIEFTWDTPDNNESEMQVLDTAM